MLRTHLARRMLARFGDLRDPRGHRVQIDVRRDGQERLVIEYRHAFEPSLEERTTNLALPIGQPRQRFFQAFHEPTDALQSMASRRHPLRVLEPSLNPIIRNSQRLPGLIARWKQPSPTSHDLLVRPTIGDFLVEPKQHCRRFFGYSDRGRLKSPWLGRADHEMPVLFGLNEIPYSLVDARLIPKPRFRPRVGSASRGRSTRGGSGDATPNCGR